MPLYPLFGTIGYDTMEFDRDKLVDILKSISELPKIKEVQALRKRLQQELKEKPKKKHRISKEQMLIHANEKRSSKQKRYWRYIKLIRDNFPNLQTNEIRSQLKERRQGRQVRIQDAIWQNPSP